MNNPLAKDRIKTIEELEPILEAARADGQKIVSTNGVFDFVHTGHLTYLEKSRQLGDLMIIALNSDASTKRIKGPHRPINNEQDRATVLAGLRCVDYVVIFEEDTASEIIEKIKPSIHTKAGDYNPEKMPETKSIRKVGGEIVIVPIEQGYSNSGQYEKIKEAEEAEKFERPEWLAGAQAKS